MTRTFRFPDTDDDGEETGDFIEGSPSTDEQATPLTPTAYFVQPEAELLSNEDGTVTRLDSAIPGHPTKEGIDD